MERTDSADGTRIAYEHVGEGYPVVVVGGAFSTWEAGLPLATALAGLGLSGVAYDRRARAGSGDTAPYAPFREAEDLTAVIDAVGGRAAVLGHSSGAVLALFAAGEGGRSTSASTRPRTTSPPGCRPSSTRDARRRRSCCSSARPSGCPTR
jgi:pimeloyl-ACP methyl ester carboxylesterase